MYIKRMIESRIEYLSRVEKGKTDLIDGMKKDINDSQEELAEVQKELNDLRIGLSIEESKSNLPEIKVTCANLNEKQIRRIKEIIQRHEMKWMPICRCDIARAIEKEN